MVLFISNSVWLVAMLVVRRCVLEKPSQFRTFFDSFLGSRFNLTLLLTLVEMTPGRAASWVGGAVF
jgi:hypothetical protein